VQKPRKRRFTDTPRAQEPPPTHGQPRIRNLTDHPHKFTSRTGNQLHRARALNHDHRTNPHAPTAPASPHYLPDPAPIRSLYRTSYRITCPTTRTNRSLLPHQPHRITADNPHQSSLLPQPHRITCPTTRQSPLLPHQPHRITCPTTTNPQVPPTTFPTPRRPTTEWGQPVTLGSLGVNRPLYGSKAELFKALGHRRAFGSQATGRARTPGVPTAQRDGHGTVAPLPAPRGVVVAQASSPAAARATRSTTGRPRVGRRVLAAAREFLVDALTAHRQR
jgi:hypothetical protein